MQWIGVAVVLIPRAGTVTGIVSIESFNMARTKNGHYHAKWKLQ